MANNPPIVLSEELLAKLDELIESARTRGQRAEAPAESPLRGYYDDVANNLNNVAANATVGAVAASAVTAWPVAGILAGIGAVAAATSAAAGGYAQVSRVGAVDEAEAKAWEEYARQVPLETLLQLRSAAITKKG